MQTESRSKKVEAMVPEGSESLKLASPSAALPIAHGLLRLLVVVNWLTGAAIFALLVIAPHEQWILSELDLSAGPEADRVVMGLRAVAVVGLVSIPLHYAVLRRLLAIVESVRKGNPFIAPNARRLQTIAWVLVALQFLGLLVAAIARVISTPAHPFDFDAGF